MTTRAQTSTLAEDAFRGAIETLALPTALQTVPKLQLRGKPDLLGAFFNTLDEAQKERVRLVHARTRLLSWVQSQSEPAAILRQVRVEDIFVSAKIA